MQMNEFSSADENKVASSTAVAASARRRLSVRHETVYRYQGAASLGYSLAWLTPRPLPTQDLREHRINVFPKPRFLHESLDAFGNVQHYFEIHKGHSELRIQSQAIVECAPALDFARLQEPWESYCPSGVSGAAGDPPAWDFIYDTELAPIVNTYSDYARLAFTPGRALGEALLAFNAQIYTDFEYVPGATAVDTPLADVWEQRTGVCQDFAHLAVSCLRGIGLATAYVSGYLLTYPNPGESKRIGADASHAWFAVWAGAEIGWVQLDPTNNLIVGDEHIVVALGRDYSDTPPVKGVCFGGGQHQLSVGVTVEQLASY